MPRLAIQNSLALQAPPSMAVDFRDRRQRWEGMGASEPFLPLASDASMDLLFDPTAGIGLSFMRVGIEIDGNTMGTWGNVTKAVARGAKIKALPWSADPTQKTPAIQNGGHLNANQYGAWSDKLAAFQANMIANTSGVTALYALSAQSEPDFSDGTFAQMPYTTTEYVNFWKVLAPKVAVLNPRPLLVAGDTADWPTQAWSYTDALLADAAAAPYVDRAGGHQYDGMGASTGNWTGLKWMTEYSTFDAYDGTMANGLGIALAIHSAIVNGLVSAYDYWWMVRSNQTDNQGLIDTVKGNPKRYYVFGNYSKFVRPGWYRVGVSGSVSNVSATAWLNFATGDFAMVAINNGAATQFTCSIVGLVSHTVTPWVTDASRDLASQSAVPVSNGVFTLALPASSVTTYVGSGA